MNLPETEEASIIDRAELVRLFGVLSHDLKSPIFSVDGFSDLLVSEYGDRLDDEGRDFLARIRNAAQQMRRVLDEMSRMVKLLSRADSRRRVPLSELLEQVRMKNNYLIDEGGVDLQIPADLPDVHGDPEKLAEAIGALVSNALTFTDRPVGERRVTIDVTTGDGTTMICVSDNGIGLDTRYAEQIFELGLKLDKSRGPGPGYGLYLARRVAESHGGRITVESKLGEGSRFCMTLPAA